MYSLCFNFVSVNYILDLSTPLEMTLLCFYVDAKEIDDE